MGGSGSTRSTQSTQSTRSTPVHVPKPSPEPPRGPVEFDKPWRVMQWGKNNHLEQKLKSYKLQSDIPFVRILLAGDVGVGKSSFINSVSSAFQKHITSAALVDGTGGTSFTKKYTTHYIEGEDGSRLPFVFNDIMGLEADVNGASVQDIINALRGLLKEGYNFAEAAAGNMKESGYKSNRSLEDQTFCLVNVIAADKVSMMNSSVIGKLRNLREAASNLDIPQVIIMTRPDLACPLVRDDKRKIYTSKKIKEKMQECSNALGIPLCNIFPVKNYHEEMDTDDDMDLLILKAVDQIVYLAVQAAKKVSAKSSDQSE